MTNLAKKNCKPCEKGMKPLSINVAQTLLPKLHPGWEIDHKGKSIQRLYKFQNYYETVAFVNAVSWVAHKQDHHPLLEIAYSSCRVEFTTHAIKGLSVNDFICAAKIDTLYNPYMDLQENQENTDVVPSQGDEPLAEAKPAVEIEPLPEVELSTEIQNTNTANVNATDEEILLGFDQNEADELLSVTVDVPEVSTYDDDDEEELLLDEDILIGDQPNELHASETSDSTSNSDSVFEDTLIECEENETLIDDDEDFETELLIDEEFQPLEDNKQPLGQNSAASQNEKTADDEIETVMLNTSELSELNQEAVKNHDKAKPVENLNTTESETPSWDAKTVVMSATEIHARQDVPASNDSHSPPDNTTAETQDLSHEKNTYDEKTIVENNWDAKTVVITDDDAADDNQLNMANQAESTQIIEPVNNDNKIEPLKEPSWDAKTVVMSTEQLTGSYQEQELKSDKDSDNKDEKTHDTSSAADKPKTDSKDENWNAKTVVMTAAEITAAHKIANLNSADNSPEKPADSGMKSPLAGSEKLNTTEQTSSNTDQQTTENESWDAKTVVMSTPNINTPKQPNDSNKDVSTDNSFDEPGETTVPDASLNYNVNIAKRTQPTSDSESEEDWNAKTVVLNANEISNQPDAASPENKKEEPEAEKIKKDRWFAKTINMDPVDKNKPLEEQTNNSEYIDTLITNPEDESTMVLPENDTDNQKIDPAIEDDDTLIMHSNTYEKVNK